METNQELIPVSVVLKELGIANSSLSRAVAKAGIKPVKRGFFSPAQLQVLKEVLAQRANNGLSGEQRVGGNGVKPKEKYRISVFTGGQWVVKRIGLSAKQAKAAIKMYSENNLRAVAIQYL